MTLRPPWTKALPIRCETVPLAFGADPPLLGILTLPPSGCASNRGVVVCPPFGHQNICTYRPLRTLARRIAERGLPVMRFDWPGCGDSGDPEPESAGLEGWLTAVSDACRLLREETAVDEVALVGLRIGATVALLEATANEEIGAAVLLAPQTSGRAYLRELRALEALAAHVFSEPDSPPPPLPEGAVEAGGFLIPADDVRALRRIDLATADFARVPARTLIVAPEADGATKVLAPRLSEAGSSVETRVLPELARMWDSSQLSFLPPSCGTLVADWLSEGMRERTQVRRTLVRPPARAAAPLALGQGEVEEQATLLDGQRGRLFAVACSTAADEPFADWVVFLNTGRIRRVGTNRLSTAWARTWAPRGLPSLRLDVHGVGDSDGESNGDQAYLDDGSSFYRREVFLDIRRALDWLAAERGARRFALMGLCAGATQAFETALLDERVTGVGMINPPALVWDEGLLLAKAWQEAREAAAVSPLMLLRLMKGRGGAWRRRALRGSLLQLRGGTASHRHPERIVEAIQRLRANDTALTALYTARDTGLGYLEDALGPDYATRLESLGVPVEVVRGPDHTFRPLWSHELLRDRMERLLSTIGFLAAEPEPQAVEAC